MKMPIVKKYSPTVSYQTYNKHYLRFHCNNALLAKLSSNFPKSLFFR